MQGFAVGRLPGRMPTDIWVPEMFHLLARARPIFLPRRPPDAALLLYSLAASDVKVMPVNPLAFNAYRDLPSHRQPRLPSRMQSSVRDVLLPALFP